MIKKINEKGVDNQGNEVPFIVIVASGNYRIKGMVSELHVAELKQEQPVTIYSRVDEKAQWVGTITKVDTDSKEKSSTDGQGENSAEQSSRYPFTEVRADRSDPSAIFFRFCREILKLLAHSA